MAAVRRFEAGDAPAVIAIIGACRTTSPTTMSAKAERDAGDHEAGMITDSGPVTGSPSPPEIILRAEIRGWPSSGLAGPRARHHAARLCPGPPGRRRNQPRGGQDPGALVRRPALRGHPGLLGTNGFGQVDTIDPLPDSVTRQSAAIYVAALRATR